jgi:hypothetical protein
MVVSGVLRPAFCGVLGAIMVREGLAWAFVRYSRDYVEQFAKARRAWAWLRPSMGVAD